MAKRKPDAGEYDKFFLLKEQKETNTLGTVTHVPYTHAELWCSLRPKGGRVIYDSAIVKADVTHIARTWWRPDVTPTPTMYLYSEDTKRTFQISAVLNLDEADTEWEFHLCEVV